MDSGTTEQHREDTGITEQRREDSGTMEKRKSLLFTSAMDSGTTEQHREDSEITEQRREDSGTMEKQKSLLFASAMNSGTTEQRREDSEITEQRREDLGTMEKQKSLLFASEMDSGTTEQCREDSEITEQRREDSGTMEKREDSGTMEKQKSLLFASAMDSGTTEQRREDSEITEQRREDSGTTEQPREDLETMEKRKSHIFKLLEDGVSTVVLVGDTGMGKTWMAREISEWAVREGSCYESLWLSVTEKYDINLLYESIAHQLSLSFITEEWGDEEEDIDSNRDAKDMKVEEEPESLKHRIKAKLEDKKRSATLHEGKKYLLLVLDDEGNKMKDNDLKDVRMSEMKDNDLKILVTGRKSPIIEGNAKEVTFEPLSFEGSLTILENSIDKKFRNIQGFEDLFDAISKKSKGLPAAITVIAGALNYIARHSSEDWTLESALEKAAYYEKAANGVNPLISCAYEMFPSSVMQNCFWHSVQFFRKHGGVHYNELIAHWIMEGNFGPFDHIEKVYQEGHCVLMELLDRGMLKIQDDNIVSMEAGA